MNALERYFIKSWREKGTEEKILECPLTGQWSFTWTNMTVWSLSRDAHREVNENIRENSITSLRSLDS